MHREGGEYERSLKRRLERLRKSNRIPDQGLDVEETLSSKTVDEGESFKTFQPDSGSCLNPHPRGSEDLNHYPSQYDRSMITVAGSARSMGICFLSQPVFPYSKISLYVDRGVKIQNFFTDSL